MVIVTNCLQITFLFTDPDWSQGLLSVVNANSSRYTGSWLIKILRISDSALNGTPLSHCHQGSGSIAKKQAEKTLRGKDWGGVLSFGYDVVIKLMNSKGLWLSLPDQAGQTCNTGWGETHEVPPPYWGATIGSAWLLAERDSFFFGSGRTVATGGLSMLHWIAPHPCPSTWAVLIGLSWCCTGQMDR